VDVFSESTARQAATQWGFGPTAQLALLCISENATYLVTDPASGTRGVLRLNRPGYHSRQAIESELAWTTTLRREGVVTTPTALRTLGGSRVAILDEGASRHAVMFTFAEGVEPAAGSLQAEMPSIGQIAARLHTHSRRWTRPAGFERFSWDLTAAFGDAGTPGRWGDWRDAEPDAVAVLAAAQSSVVASLTDYGRAPERFGLIHGDLRAANLLLDRACDGTTITVIDFDDCGLSWYGYDVAAAVSFLEHRPELSELAAGFLTGYRQLAAFDRADLEALPALIMLRRLQLLAWSATHADTEMVLSLGPDFATQTAEVAERFLARTLLGNRQDL
jgi:Ser/Thr protein kinase RdoA (MazF antagonist)